MCSGLYRDVRGDRPATLAKKKQQKRKPVSEFGSVFNPATRTRSHSSTSALAKCFYGCPRQLMLLKWATEIKVRAKRRAGGMLAESKASRGA